MATIITEELALQVAGRVKTFPAGKTASVGAHRFCDVLLDDPDGNLPLRAAVFSSTGGDWLLSNACRRHLVLHADGHPPLSLAPGQEVGLTGAPFVLSVPSTGTSAAEVLASFGSDATAPAGIPWLVPTGTPASHIPAAAGTSATPPRRRRAVVALSVAVTVLLTSGAAATVVQRSRLAAATRPPHPSTWDPRLTDLVAFVEQDRGLRFQEPVYVDFLPPEEFEAGAGQPELSAEDRREIERAVGLLRSIGLLEGDVDLLARIMQLHSEGTLAYYDPATERITVRGTELTEAVRGTLVHELTHVLQDQHFDLSRIEDDTGGRLRSVAEGDASRTEDRWVNQLDATARAAYDGQSEMASETADLEGIPEVLLAFFGAPYALGRGFVETLAAVGGNPAIDRAIQNPPESDEQLLDPFRYIDNDMPLPVAEPSLRPGEERLDSEGDFGALALFMMLAQRLDERQALQAVDGWGGDAYVDFERDGRPCTRVALRGDTQADTDEMAVALSDWAASMPEGSASSSTGNGQIEFEACDPGVEFAMGEPRMLRAQSYLVARAQVAVGFIEMGITARESKCFTDGLIAKFGPGWLLSEVEPSRAEERVMVEVAAACRR